MADIKRKATTRPASRRGMTKGQIRAERRQRSKSRQRRKRAILTFAGVLFAIIFITALVVPSNTQSTNVQGINTGGHIAIDTDDGRGHIDDNTTPHDDYTYHPATSGPHWFGPSTAAGVPSPARWGRYDGVLPDEVLVHNLEHGGIGIHYNCPAECPDLIKQLDDILPRNPSQYLMSPYPNMEATITITAWRHHLSLEEVDVDQIREFIDEYQNRAPESVQGNSF